MGPDSEMKRGRAVWGVDDPTLEAACSTSAGNWIANTDEGNPGLSQEAGERVAWLEYAARIPRGAWQEKIAGDPDVPAHVIAELGLNAVTRINM